MQFRRLSAEELAELEPQFIRFLATSSITGPDWEKLKVEKPTVAESMIDTFSDLVYARVISEVSYLEWKHPRDLRAFAVEPDRIVMYGLRLVGDSSLDLTQSLTADQVTSLLAVSGAKLQLYHGERAYRNSREQEVFQLMEGGALISREGDLFKLLSSLRQS